MGVQNLTSLINSNPWLTKSHKLCNTKLVIDGRGLQHFVYDHSVNKTINSKYGGDYVTYEQDLREFFKLLADCAIQPIIVLPGGKHPDIPHTGAHIGHRPDTVGNQLKKPVLLSFVRSTLLKELKIEHIRARFEGEVDAVNLANSLKCPLLIQDSDYYVLDAQYGVISFDNLRTATGAKITLGLRAKTDPSVKDLEVALAGLGIAEGAGGDIDAVQHLNSCIFFRSDFLAAFENLSADVLPLFCTIVGNSVRRREFPRDQVFYTIKYVANGMNINSNFVVNSRNNRSLVELLTWLQNKTFDQALEQFTRKLPRPDPKRRQNMRNDFTKSVNLTKNWMSGDYALECLVDHIEGRRCDRDHSYKWQERSISDEVVRRIIEDKVTPSLISIYFYGVLTLMTQNEDYAQESSFKVAHDILKSFTSMIRPDPDDSATVSILDRQSRDDDGEVSKETHGMLLLPNTRLKNGLKMPCWSELEEWTSDNKLLLAYMVLDLNNDDLNEITSVLEVLQKDIPEIKNHEKTLTMLAAILKYISSKLSGNEQEELFKKFSVAMFVSAMYYLCEHSVGGNDNLIKSSLNPIGEVDSKILHCYAQFQAVLRLYSQVNALLDYPTPSFDVGKMFNGVLVHNLVVCYDKLEVSENVSKLFCLI